MPNTGTDVILGTPRDFGRTAQVQFDNRTELEKADERVWLLPMWRLEEELEQEYPNDEYAPNIDVRQWRIMVSQEITRRRAVVVETLFPILDPHLQE
jgi:hypothetical protein